MDKNTATGMSTFGGLIDWELARMTNIGYRGPVPTKIIRPGHERTPTNAEALSKRETLGVAKNKPLAIGGDVTKVGPKSIAVGDPQAAVAYMGLIKKKGMK